VLGKKLQQADGVPVEGGTDPSASTPPEVTKAQKRLDVCQWLIPALTAGISVLTSLQGEQQHHGARACAPSRVSAAVLVAPVSPLRGPWTPGGRCRARGR
jgi:hypothetical protein